MRLIGANTAPTSGRPDSTRAMLTVKSAERLMNSLVPSSGSTSRKASPSAGGTNPSAHSSSATQGRSETAARSPSRMMRSAARSASVTGERSALWLTSAPARNTSMITRPAESASRSNSAARARWSDAAALVILLVAVCALTQPLLHPLYHVLGSGTEGFEVDLGLFRSLVGRGQPGEVGDRSGLCLGIEPLRIAAGALVERRVDEDLDELARRHQLARQLPFCPERRDEGDQHDQPGIGHQLGNLGDAANILDPVGITKAQIPVQAMADIV